MQATAGPFQFCPYFSKLLEKLIHRRIAGYLDKYWIIRPCQFGFRKHYSTEIALLHHKQIIFKALEQGFILLGAFLDFSMVFNSANHCILL